MKTLIHSLIKQSIIAIAFMSSSCVDIDNKSNIDNTLYHYNISLLENKMELLNIRNKEQIAKHIYKNIDMKHYDDIIAIIYKESRGDTLAFNGHDYGLMQINKQHKFDRNQIFNTEYNLIVGYNIFLDCCSVNYDKRFKLYNGSDVYQRSINRIIRRLNENS